MACWTVVIFSASSSGISVSNSSSRAITSSTVSSESAPRSSTKEDSFLISASFTPSCSATIFLTRCSTFSMAGSFPFVRCYRNSKVRIVAESHWHFSSHIHAAVDVERRARNVGGARRGEEGHDRRDVFRTPEPAQRNLLEQRRPLLFRERPGHVGVDKSRRDAVDRDASAADLARQRAGHSGDAGLRRGIIDLPCVAARGDHGRDVDDAPGARLHHAAQHGLGEAEHRLEVGVDHRVPLGFLHAHGEVVLRDPRVVDEDRHRAVVLLEIRHDGIDVRLDPDVELHAPALHARGAKGVADRLRARRGSRRADHGGAPRAELERDRLADAARSAAYQRALALEIHHPPFASCAPDSRPARSASASPWSPSAMRLLSGARTFPGPHSKTCVTPCDAIALTHSTQRTAWSAWLTSALQMPSASECDFASTLWITGMRGALTLIAESASRSRAAAGAISEEWNGALTGSATARLAPRAFAASIARLTASA